MGTYFFGLNTANSALQANQQVIETIDHNVANASTPGYSQQTANLVAAPPYMLTTTSIRPPGLAGEIGTGVQVQSVTRSRDALLDNSFRIQNQYAGQWSTLDNQYTSIQSVFAEPSTSGLSNKLSAFWNSWQTLADDPTNQGARSTVQQNGVQLATTLNGLASQLSQAQQYADQTVGQDVTQINNIASQIANLNGQISIVNITGQQPNDLMDSRDQLLDQLAKITPITTSLQSNGMVTVNLATQVPGATNLQVARPSVTPLVQNTTATGLAVNAMGVPYYNVAGNPTYVDPTAINPPNATTVPLGGQLGAAIQLRDTVLGGTTGMMAQIDNIAKTLVQDVNNVHTTGYDASGTTTGAAFFQVMPPATLLTSPYTTVTTVTAANITVASGILASPNAIATAAQSNQPGDGSLAQQIANLRTLTNSGASPLPNVTIQQGYDAVIATMGANAQIAKNNTQNQTVVMNSLSAQRQSIGGVNLDEQMTLLIQFQHNYSAAARMVTTIDSMLDTIINHMGLGN